MNEKRTIWLRLGCCLTATPEEIDALLCDDTEGKAGAEILWRAFREGRLEPEADTYIPSECIEDYNHEYGTDYVEDEIGFYL